MTFTAKKSFYNVFRRPYRLSAVSLISCFLLLTGPFSNLSAQELPPIQNFTPLDYSGEYQNWAISQSLEKRMYVANNSSLLEFDGVKWNKYPSPNRSVIRSVAALDEVVYTGCYLDFGFWSKDEFGNLFYTSLSDSLDAPLTQDEQFWDILPIENLILFRSLQRIYIYDTLERRIEFFECPSRKGQLFAIDKSVFFQIDGLGLFTIKNGKPTLISDVDVFRKDLIVGVFALGEHLVAITEEAKFYRISEGAVEVWNINAYADLKDLSIYTSTKLQDGSFILGSISNGVYQVSANGDLVRHIDRSKGLNNNTVLSIFEDDNHNLWLGLDNGISVINLYSPFNEYIDNLGRLGTVYTAKQHQDYLYLGTNQGLFYRQLSGTDDFAFMAGTKGQVWNLDVVRGSLFCGHNLGTFIVKADEAKLISNFPGTWGVKPMPGNERLILQGNFTGLTLLEKGPDGWRFRNKLEGFDISSRFFEIEGSTILVNHEHKGIYQLQVDENLEEVDHIDFQEPIGRRSNIFQFRDQYYYSCNEGIFAIDPIDFTFTFDSTLSQIVLQPEEIPTTGIVSFQQPDHLWWFTSNSLMNLSQNKLTGKLTAQEIPVPSFLHRKLGVEGFENITPLTDEKYLIGIADGFLILDLDKITPITYEVILSDIAKGSFSETATKVPLDQDLTLSYKENSIHFWFSVPQYDKFTEVQYQYQLDHRYEAWSPWSLQPEVFFGNLPFGSYEFRLRAKVANVISDNVVRFRFEIQKPWYLSNLAIAVYILGFTLFLVVVNRLYTSYYRKQLRIIVDKQERALRLKKLEANEKLIQMRNEKLQSDIASKNRELAISTMSIVNKNKFLFFIKDQLKRSKTGDPVIKATLRSIDQNINSEDDWELFKTAFNHADKDFLQKIKTRHESLTPEDLRLCAYLRLNLASKEIAPLLNISVKSVEMKRYRLRKKLDLPREENLTDYILTLN